MWGIQIDTYLLPCPKHISKWHQGPQHKAICPESDRGNMGNKLVIWEEGYLCCPHKIGLWTWLWEIFLVYNWSGRAKLVSGRHHAWADSPGLYKKQLCSWFLLHSCLQVPGLSSSCLDFPGWQISQTDESDKPFRTPSFFWSMFFFNSSRNHTRILRHKEHIGMCI